jgi:hypothetical protein
MLIDSTGLGYTIRHSGIFVHYPTRTVIEGQQQDGASANPHRFEAGWPIGPIPPAYMADPPNAITAERVGLWKQLALAETRED